MGLRDWFGSPEAKRLTRAEVRIRDLERQVAFLLEHQGLAPEQVPGADLTETRRHLVAGRKIDAIKAYRAATGAGLAEAKAAVENLEVAGRTP
jgi:ribosomal protein L7/L12